MIRIIFLSLLTLTLSCSNTCPEPADEQTTSTQAAPQEPAVNPATAEAAAPVAVATPEKTPEIAPGTKKVSEPAKALRKPRKPRKPRTPRKNEVEAPITAPVETPAQEIPAAVEAATEPESAAAVAAATATAVAAATASEVAAETVSETPELPAANQGGEFAPTTAVTGSPFSPAAREIPSVDTLFGKNHPRSGRFLPTRRRIDREVNKLKFAYKGEIMMGITASYGTLSSDDTDFMIILDNINASGTIASVKPFLGYFYRDNNCIGVRFGYQHTSGTLNTADIDLGESNDVILNLPYIDLKSNNFSFGVFHRSYAGLDPKGRFGLFAEFELSVSTGKSEFAYDTHPRIFSDNTQVKLSFNPGAAVYIFPNVCATLSFGLGGIQYTSVTQKDGDGNEVGTRKSSKMKFKLNLAAINFGMTIHLWDKKKQN